MGSAWLWQLVLKRRGPAGFSLLLSVLLELGIRGAAALTLSFGWHGKTWDVNGVIRGSICTHFLQLSLSNNNLCVWPPSFKPSLTWLCFLPAEIRHVVRDCSIPPKVAGKCRCPVKVLELDAVIYVWWVQNRSYTKGNKKSVLSLDMEKMVDCRVAVGISEMLNLKELKSEVMHECLTLVLAALEPTQIGYMKLKWKQRGWINTP